MADDNKCNTRAESNQSKGGNNIGDALHRMPEVIDDGRAQKETVDMVPSSPCWQFTPLRMGIDGFYPLFEVI